MLALKIGRKKGVSKDRGKDLVNALRNIDQNVSKITSKCWGVKKVPQCYFLGFFL
ncbi:MAG: hypothetical protein CM1200mP13_13780 [Candidatus Pelagibacterales bacterium]|nr:MAG: hypothetical protein CM1200mP13_13780 [Pelagibacterales bacterium]